MSSQPDSMTAAADEALMRSYQQGHLQALETLFARHARAVYTFFLYTTLSGSAAERLSQLAWLEVHQQRVSYDGSQFLRWLLTISAHVRREHEPPAAKEHDNKTSPPAPPFLADNPLDRALAGMADSYREVIVLHRLLQLPFDDIAVVLGATAPAVKNRAQQGYVQLAEVAHKADPLLPSSSNSQPRPTP